MTATVEKIHVEEIDLGGIDPKDLPLVQGWKLLVKPAVIEEVSAGGIVLTGDIQEANKYLGQVGQVLTLGARCYEHERFGPENMPNREKWWCKPGDWVLFGQYKGHRTVVKGAEGPVELLFLNDDEIIAVLPSPELIRAYT